MTFVDFQCSGARRGSFQFEVNDGVHLSRPASFLIEASPLQLRLEVLSTLGAFPGIVQPITARHLRAATNDPNQTRPILFTVRSGPRLGRLVVGGIRNESTSFTQADVGAGRVGYEHTGTATETAWSQTDSFVFDVWTEYAEQPLLSRLFNISVSYEHVNGDNVNWLMTLGTVSVREGGAVVIGKSALDVTPLQRRLAAATDDVVVRYVVVDPPRHGVLRVNVSTADHFTQQVVDAGQLGYQHDGSDTASDHFAFSLRVAAAAAHADEFDEPPRTFAFNISVLPVDDQPFRLVTMSPEIELVQGSTHVITRDVLLTQDDDTPPARLVYVVDTPPTNGHLRHADLPPTDNVDQFSQLDVDQLKLSFVSDGSVDNSFFHFHVSDGVHKPLHKVVHLPCMFDHFFFLFVVAHRASVKWNSADPMIVQLASRVCSTHATSKRAVACFEEVNL